MCISLGRIKRVTTVSVQLPCSGQYQIYPFDKIRCSVYITGNIPSSLINISWLGGKPLFYPPWLKISSYVLLNYEMNGTETFEPIPEDVNDPLSLVSLTNANGYRIWMELQREFRYHLVVMYLPTIIFSVVAWMSLWFPLPPDMTRAGICKLARSFRHCVKLPVDESFRRNLAL